MRAALRQHVRPQPTEQALASAILFHGAFPDMVPALESLTSAGREQHEKGNELGALLGWVTVDSPTNIRVTLAPRTYWRRLSRLAGTVRLPEKPWQHQDASDVLRLVFVTPHETAMSTITFTEIQESAK